MQDTSSDTIPAFCASATVAYSLEGKRVWVAGHSGMVGSAITRRLAREACIIITVPSKKVDLRRQLDVETWLESEKPDTIFLTAARVGGIHANMTYPADFLYDNLAIELNIIHAAHRCGVEKLLFLGSSCIYPRHAPQPIKEEALLSGPLESTNESYSIAKIAGIKLCQAYRRQNDRNFISVMPTNLYGPGDNFHPENSHVPAALLRRFHKAKLSSAPKVTVWGTGKPRRDFMYVEDLADACVFLMTHYSGDPPINVGTGQDISIADFADAIRSTVGFDGEICFDTARPDGMPRKALDIGRLTGLGWESSTSLKSGLEKFYQWYQDNINALRTA